MARKNIQISQLKSELTDAQRRLTVLESDPGASNANTLVYEQKYNDVKKQYVSPTYMFCPARGSGSSLCGNPKQQRLTLPTGYFSLLL